MMACTRLRLPQHPGGQVAFSELLKELVSNTYFKDAHLNEDEFKSIADVKLDVSFAPERRSASVPLMRSASCAFMSVLGQPGAQRTASEPKSSDVDPKGSEASLDVDQIFALRVLKRNKTFGSFIKAKQEGSSFKKRKEQPTPENPMPAMARAAAKAPGMARAAAKSVIGALNVPAIAKAATPKSTPRMTPRSVLGAAVKAPKAVISALSLPLETPSTGKIMESWRRSPEAHRELHSEGTEAAREGDELRVRGAARAPKPVRPRPSAQASVPNSPPPGHANTSGPPPGRPNSPPPRTNSPLPRTNSPPPRTSSPPPGRTNGPPIGRQPAGLVMRPAHGVERATPTAVNQARWPTGLIEDTTPGTNAPRSRSQPARRPSQELLGAVPPRPQLRPSPGQASKLAPRPQPRPTEAVTYLFDETPTWQQRRPSWPGGSSNPLI